MAAVTDELKALVVDDALKAGTQIGPVVDQKQLDQDLRYIEHRPRGAGASSPGAASG